MNGTDEVQQRLINLMRSRKITTFFLNGPPGTGKSYFLGSLRESLPSILPHSLVFGPYPVSPDCINDLGRQIIHDWHARGLLAQEADLRSDDLVAIWQRIGEQAQVSNNQSAIVLVDLVGFDPILDASRIGTLFSGARALEGQWRFDFRLHFVFAGDWNPIALKTHYDQTAVSYPYTVGYNYWIWDGISQMETLALFRDKRSQDFLPVRGRVLHELTGGHPSAALEVLQGIRTGEPQFILSLLDSIGDAASHGQTSQRLVNRWAQLPGDVLKLVRRLILKRYIKKQPSPFHDLLIATGIAQPRQIGHGAYLGFRCWYIEQIIRQHLDTLGIGDSETYALNNCDLIPEIAELNTEAYQLINSIENAGRNFAAMYLQCTQPNEQQILSGHVLHDRNGEQSDLLERAVDWRNRSMGAGLMVKYNPLISYCSTGDLTRLIQEIAQETGSHSWQQIARAMRGVADIRHAVMHNQLIDDQALQRLYDLRCKIFEALTSNEIDE